MAVIKEAFGAANQSFPCTITSLANGAYRASVFVNNQTNLYQDALVGLSVKTNASGVLTTGTILVFAYGTADLATFTDGVTGIDAVITPTSPTNLKFIGQGNAVAPSTTYNIGPFSVAAAFGNILPMNWGVVVLNNTGAAFDATTAKVFWQGYFTTVQ